MTKGLRFMSLVVMALAVAACCIAGPETTTPATTGQMYIDRERSQVWRQPSGGSESEITSTVEGHTGDAIWARQSGRALLRWPDLYIRLRSDSRHESGMRMTDATPTWLRLGLVAGAAHISGKPATGQRVAIDTGNGRVVLTGTSLMLAYHPGSRSTIVRVFQGRVEASNLADPDNARTVQAGQGAVIQQDKPPRLFGRLEDMRPLARELGLWDLFHQIELEAQTGFGPPGSASAPVQIVFVDQAVATPTRTPTLRPTRTPTLKPTRTATRTPTPTVDVPEITMRYWADQECLLDVACTTLRWQVDNAQAVTLNGEGVGGYDSRMACPPGPAGEYTLRAMRGRDVVEQTIVVRRVTADLRADNEQIQQGLCTTLRWDVEGASAVYVNGAGVAGHDSRNVCPSVTTRYDLNVESVCGAINRAVTVVVVPASPQDTAGPAIGDLTTQPPGDMLCERSQIDVSTRITDDMSGVRNAELWVLFIPFNGIGAWDAIPMNRSGDTFSATITGLGLGEVTIYVRAWDNAGNVSETPKRRIGITLC